MITGAIFIQLVITLLLSNGVKCTECYSIEFMHFSIENLMDFMLDQSEIHQTKNVYSVIKRDYSNFDYGH